MICTAKRMWFRFLSFEICYILQYMMTCTQRLKALLLLTSWQMYYYHDAEQLLVEKTHFSVVTDAKYLLLYAAAVAHFKT